MNEQDELVLAADGAVVVRGLPDVTRRPHQLRMRVADVGHAEDAQTRVSQERALGQRVIDGGEQRPPSLRLHR